jgi:hypothetical protein
MSEPDDRRSVWVMPLALVAVAAGIAAVSLVAGKLPHRDDAGAMPFAPTTRTASTATTISTTIQTLDMVLEPTPGWETVGPVPVESPYGPAVVVDTAEELLFVTGGANRNTLAQPYCGAQCEWVGAAFDLATGATRILPESPMCAEGTPEGIWTGDELIVWSVTPLDPECPVAAAYSPEGNQWRALDSDLFRGQWREQDSFGPGVWSQVVWTGQELLSTGGLAYRPDTGETRRIPAADESPMFTGDTVGSPPEVSWTGSEMLVLGSEGVIMIDPDGVIVDGPAPPISEFRRASVWTGSELLAVAGDMDAAVFDPVADRWEEVDSPPLSAGCWGGSLQWFASGDLALLQPCDPRVGSFGWPHSSIVVWSGDWKLLPPPTLGWVAGPLAVGGGYLFSLATPSISVSGHLLSRYRLPELVDGQMPQPGFFPVGQQYLDVPSGWEVMQSYGKSTGYLNDTLVVELSTPAGVTCRVESPYIMKTNVPFTTEATVLTRDRDGLPIPARETEADDHGFAHVVVVSESRFVDVACPSLDDAETLAAGLWQIDLSG